MKIFLLLIFIAFGLNEFWYLTELKKEKKISSMKVKIPMLPVLSETNTTLSTFFDSKLWQKSDADIEKKVKTTDQNISEKKLYDLNTSVELVITKGTKQLCRGKKCITIRGIFANTILLEETNGTIIVIKPKDIIFENIKLVQLDDTRLFFINEKTGEQYKLKFFSYKQRKDNNETYTKFNDLKKDKK